MNPELTLKITNGNLNILQHMHAAATTHISGILIGIIFIPLLIMTFAFPLVIHLTKDKGDKVLRNEVIPTLITMFILDITFGIALYVIGQGFVGEGYYESKEMTVTDVEDVYSDGSKLEYVGSLISYRQDGTEDVIKTYPQDVIAKVGMHGNKHVVEMKQGLVKKGDVITVRGPEGYIGRYFPKKISPDTDYHAELSVHVMGH